MVWSQLQKKSNDVILDGGELDHWSPVMSVLINFSCLDNKFFVKSKLLTLKQNNSDFFKQKQLKNSLRIWNAFGVRLCFSWFQCYDLNWLKCNFTKVIINMIGMKKSPTRWQIPWEPPAWWASPPTTPWRRCRGPRWSSWRPCWGSPWWWWRLACPGQPATAARVPGQEAAPGLGQTSLRKVESFKFKRERLLSDCCRCNLHICPGNYWRNT